jgi:hypothetical protein
MLLQTNDNWNASQGEAIAGLHLAPADSHEAAILRVVPPGNYTAIVAGHEGGTGIGLVEVYYLP